MARARILIVEDEKIISLDLRRRLEKFGYEVAGLAANAEDALELARELQPDLILMDIMLAGDTDGIEAAKVIRERLHIPVIFLTAYADERTLTRAKEAEPFGYILKPFKERELYTTIDVALYKSAVDRRIQEQESLFSAILNSASDGIIACDADWNVIFLNPIAEDLCGVNEDDVKALPLSSIFELVDRTTELAVQLPGNQDEKSSSGPLYFENTALKNQKGALIRVQGAVSTITESDEIQGRVIVFRDVTRIAKMSDTITYQARHDALTGLLNRKEFSDELQRAAREASRGETVHSFLYVDLDQFKIVNDLCGHPAGDELLRQIARSLRELTSETDVLARLGGDEFGVLLRETPLGGAHEKAREFVRVLNRTFIYQQNSFNISVSVGIVPVTGEEESDASIMAAADDACYLAKEAGGNGLRVYETTDYSFLKRRGEMEWVSRLTHALDNENFVLYAQDIVGVHDGELSRMEVLIRLQENDVIISPMEFIPAAERYNLMPSIDRLVLRRSIEFLKEHDEIPALSVNLSAGSVVDPSMLAYVLEHLEDARIDPTRLCLEITETAAIENLSRALGFMNRLRKIGVEFALDDFGSGFSSFGYLKSLPVDYIKIDGAFVKDMNRDELSMAVVESVNKLGHVMGIKTIAEYVTNESVLTSLKSLDVDYAQGYEVGMPRPLYEATPSNAITADS